MLALDCLGQSGGGILIHDIDVSDVVAFGIDALRTRNDVLVLSRDKSWATVAPLLGEAARLELGAIRTTET